MSMESEIKREYKKLTVEMENSQRRLKVLENFMKEYNIWVYPSTKTLSDYIVECVMNNNGSVTFDEITTCLYEHNIEIPKHKISMILTKHPQVLYNHESAHWELRQALPDKAA